VLDEEFRRLAAFRLALRHFQSFSEHASETLGLTSQQYQALLSIRAYAGDDPFTVTVLAQNLLIKHNSAVGLVDRIEQLGLVARRPSPQDRRSVVVELTARGKRVINKLAIEHRRELQKMAPELVRCFRHFARPTPESEWRKSSPKTSS
jgi:DNA-binding MarR family transcriptional regulator